jgi:hypothetical protein
MTPTCRPTLLWRTTAATAAALIALLVGCASPRLDAQWSDPQLAPNSLRGARIMIACEAPDLVVRRICLDQLSSEVVARSATPVVAPDISNPAPGRPLGDEAYRSAARSAGARAVLTHQLTLAAASEGSGFSIGLGAFGIGGGNVRGGLGVSAPIGGGPATLGYALASRLSDVGSGRLLWTAKASAPPSSDVTRQLSDLTRAVFDAADKAQLF